MAMCRYSIVALGVLALSCVPLPQDDEDAGSVTRVEGGEYDGWWIAEGTRVCSHDDDNCVFQVNAQQLRIDALRDGKRSFHGVVGDAGPGASTVSADGGVLVFQWPSVEGRTFAGPQVGEEIDVRLTWTYLGEGCPVGAIEVFTSTGRLLVAQGYNGIDGTVASLTREPTSLTCSWPVSPENPDCCCGTITPVSMEIRSNPPVLLAEGEGAFITFGGWAACVRVTGAARAIMPPCGHDGDFPRASAFVVALVE